MSLHSVSSEDLDKSFFPEIEDDDSFSEFRNEDTFDTTQIPEKSKVSSTVEMSMMETAEIKLKRQLMAALERADKAEQAKKRTEQRLEKFKKRSTAAERVFRAASGMPEFDLELVLRKMEEEQILKEDSTRQLEHLRIEFRDIERQLRDKTEWNMELLEQKMFAEKNTKKLENELARKVKEIAEWKRGALNRQKWDEAEKAKDDRYKKNLIAKLEDYDSGLNIAQTRLGVSQNENDTLKAELEDRSKLLDIVSSKLASISLELKASLDEKSLSEETKPVSDPTL